MNIRAFLFVFVVAFALVPGAAFANHTTGHTIEQLRAQIAALQAQLNALLAASPTPAAAPPPAPTAAVGMRFSIGDRVKTTDNLNVRSAPTTSGQRLGTQPTGAKGIVIGGPISANGFFWWNINYDAAPDGWSVEKFLEKAAVAASLGTSVTSPAIEAPNADTNADAAEAALNQEIEAEVNALDADMASLEALLK